MNRQEMMSALADAGFPVEVIGESIPDEDLEKIAQFAIGGNDDSDDDADSFADDDDMDDDDDLNFDDDFDDDDMDDDDSDDFMDDDDMDDDDMNFMDDDDDDGDDEGKSKMSSKGGRTPTKVTTTKHFNDKKKKTQKTLTFSEAQKLIDQAVTKAVDKAVKDRVNKRTQVLKFSEQIDGFLDEQVREGRVLPAQKQFYRQSLMDAAKSGKSAKGGKQTALKSRMDEIAAMPKILNFSESVDDGGRIRVNGSGAMDPARKEKLLNATPMGAEAHKRINLKN